MSALVFSLSCIATISFRRSYAEQRRIHCTSTAKRRRCYAAKFSLVISMTVLLSLVTTVTATIATAAAKASKNIHLSSHYKEETNIDIVKQQERLLDDGGNSFKVKFSMRHPTWTAARLTGGPNSSGIDVVQQKVLFAITEFLCDETNLIVVLSIKNRYDDLCSNINYINYRRTLHGSDRRYLLSDEQNEDVNQERDTDEEQGEQWIGETIVTQALSMELEQHNERGLRWTTWSVYCYVVQMGEPFISPSSANIFLTKHNSVMDGAVLVMENEVQSSLELSIKRGTMDERLRTVGATMSVVGDEIETFELEERIQLQRNSTHEIETRQDGLDPFAIRCLHIAGAALFISTILFVILLRTFGKRRLEKKLLSTKEEDRGDDLQLVTQISVDYIPPIGNAESAERLLGSISESTEVSMSPNSSFLNDDDDDLFGVVNDCALSVQPSSCDPELLTFRKSNVFDDDSKNETTTETDSDIYLSPTERSSEYSSTSFATKSRTSSKTSRTSRTSSEFDTESCTTKSRTSEFDSELLTLKPKISDFLTLRTSELDSELLDLKVRKSEIDCELLTYGRRNYLFHRNRIEDDNMALDGSNF